MPKTAIAEIITDPIEAMQKYDQIEEIALDLETGGLHSQRDPIHVITLFAPGLPPVVLHSPWKPDPQIIKWLETKHLIGHNLTSFDIPFMTKYGFDIFKSKGWVDTLTCEQMAITSDRRSVRKDLGSTIKRRIGVEVNKKIDHGSWAKPELSKEALDYVLGDIVHLHKVHQKQLKVINDLGVHDGWVVEQKIAPIVANMVSRGLPLDEDRRKEYIIQLQKSLIEYKDELVSLIGNCEVNSSKQLVAAIYKTFDIQLSSTSAETLTKLKQTPGPLGKTAGLIEAARHAKKRCMYDEDWVQQYVFNGRINSTYWQLGTDTSRFSSSDPNLQQWPRNMRTIIGFQEGDERIVKIDFSQLEIVVAAVLMREPRLLEAALNGDVHSYVGSLIYNIPLEQVTKELRRGAKAGSFTLLFAGGKPSLIGAARDQGFEMTDEMAGDAIYNFFQGLPNAYAYISRMREMARSANRNGYSIPLQIPSGPRRSLSGATVSASQLVNTLVQGSAAMGLKKSMIRMHEEGLAKYIVGTVHDEIIFQCHELEVENLVRVATQCMKEGMEQIIGIQPNVEPGVDLHWQ